MPSREVINSQKVYTRAKMHASTPWVEEKTLFWQGGQQAKGNSQSSSASFIPITPDGLDVEELPITQAMIDDAKFRMKYGIDEYLGLSDYENGFPKGKWVMVTKENSLGDEEPRFIGRFWNVGMTISGNVLTHTAMAQGYDRVLSSYKLIGSATKSVNSGGTISNQQLDRVPLLFNEHNRPNRSAAKVTLDGSDTYIFDGSQAINKDFNFWEPGDVVEYILNRINGGEYENYFIAKKFLPFHSLATNSQISLDGIDPFADQVKIREYNQNEADIWTIITQMVETNGKYTTTIGYGGTTSADFHARIEVIENV